MLENVFRYRFLLAWLCFFCPVFAIGQTAIIYGKIADRKGNAIEQATIGIPGTTTGTSSNEKGEFSLNVPANQEFTLAIRHLSHENFEKLLKLKPGEHRLLNVSLEIKSITKTVFDVKGEARRDAPMQKIQPGISRFNPSVTGNVESLLPAQSLGVTMNNELSSQYSVRGGNFDENLVYVNGIQVYRPFLIRSGNQEGLSFVNSDLVDDIYFSSGGFEAKYGDKMSSVLDIKYKKPEKFAGSVSAGLLGANVHLEQASDNKRFTQIHGIRYYSNQYLLGSSDIQGTYRPRFIDYQTYLTYGINTVWELSFLGAFSQNQYQFIPTDRKASFGTVNNAKGLTIYFGGQEVDAYTTAFGALTATFKPNYRTNIRCILSSFNTNEKETYDIEAAYRLSELETNLGSENFGNDAFIVGTGSYLSHARNYLTANVSSLEMQGEHRSKAHTWLWGLKYRYDDITDKLSEWENIDSVGYSTPYNGDYVALFETIKSNNRIATNRLMGYLQHDFRHNFDSTAFYLSAGARFHYWDFNGQTTVSPRIVSSIKPNWKSDWLFRASWGFYHQPAFYREMRNLYGIINPDIRAQKSIHYLIGADLNFTLFNRDFKFVSEAYYKQLSDIIPYELNNVRIRYYATNNAKGYATGVDFKLNGEFVKGLESWMSLSVMKTAEDLIDDFYIKYTNHFVSNDLDTIIYTIYPTKYTTDSTTIYPGYIARPTDQRVTFAITFQDHLPKNENLKMNLSIIFGSGQPTGPPTYTRWQDVFRMPPYRRVDIGFSARIIDGDKKYSNKIISAFTSAWAQIEVFNLLAVNNTISYSWIKDSSNQTYGIPNFLTSRRLNAKLIFKF